MPSIAHPLSFFQELPSAKGDSSFLFRVVVAGYRNSPRQARWEYLLEIGRELIVPVLKGEPLDIERYGKEITFIFPERWLSVHEQRQFVGYLKRNPRASELRCVNILTQNPLVAGSVPGKALSLVTFPGVDGNLEEERDV